MMDKDLSIQIRNLGKLYSIAKPKKNQMLRDVISDGVKELYRQVTDRNYVKVRKPTKIPFWALQDVSFDVRRGESIGIIGANGAGKSTLLKLLTRITAPSTGEFTIRGRVGSLLEVGTGFHTELTGRENVYLNGVILGMRKREIDRKFDEIVSFAEVEQFIDTQVKHYSSGMKMRLAFSVAAHLDPDVMLVDEVLAVGDISFQRKSLDKMGDVITGGKTVLFVSHNIAAVRALCTKAVYLEKGRLVSIGDIDSVTRQYMHNRSKMQMSYTLDRVRKKFHGQFVSVMYRNHEGKVDRSFAHDKPFEIVLETLVNQKTPNMFMSLKLYNSELEVVFETNDFETDEDLMLAREPGRYIRQLTIPAGLLAPGQYYLGTAVSEKKNANNIRVIQKTDHVAPFEVFDNGSVLARHSVAFHGLVHPVIEWKLADEGEFDELASHKLEDDGGEE